MKIRSIFLILHKNQFKVYKKIEFKTEMLKVLDINTGNTSRYKYRQEFFTRIPMAQAIALRINK